MRNKSPGFYLLLVLCLSLTALATSGQVKYVTQNGGGLLNGVSWGNAMSSNIFRQALRNAVQGDTFCLASGVYRPDNHPDSSFTIRSGIYLMGGFPTSGNPGLSDRNPKIFPTILEGDALGNDATGLATSSLLNHSTRLDNNSVLVTIDKPNAEIVMDGFIIRNGRSKQIQIKSGKTLLRNCSIQYSGNYAVDVWSPASLAGYNVTISNNTMALNAQAANSISLDSCTIQFNESPSLNGALRLMQSKAYFAHTQFINNSVANLNNCNGGAVYASESDLAFEKCAFSYNSARDGGAVYASKGNCTFIECSFSNNNAMNNGGALFMGSLSSLFQSCLFRQNSATVSGGSFWGGGRCTFDACIFEAQAGSIVGTDSMRITNSIISNGSQIAGMYALNSYKHVVKCTFTNYSNNNYAVSNLNIDSCLFEKNTALNGLVNGGTVSNSIFRDNQGYLRLILNPVSVNAAIFENKSIPCIENALMVDACVFLNNAGGCVKSTDKGGSEIRNSTFRNCISPVVITDKNPGTYQYKISKSQFIQCKSYAHGGGIFFSSYLLALDQCGFYENEAALNGGALYLKGRLQVTNCVFGRNKAESGVAAWMNYVYVSPFSGEIKQSTFFGNRSLYSGGALLVADPTSNAQLDLVHSIFWNNQASGKSNFLKADAAKINIAHSFIQQQFPQQAGDLKVQHAEKLYPVFNDTNNLEGVDGKYGTVDDGLSLQRCSPAIDFGNTVQYPSTGPLDYAGDARNRGNNLDAGAYEFQSDSLSMQGPFLLNFQIVNNNACENDRYHITTQLKPFVPGHYVYWYKNGYQITMSADTLASLPASLFKDGDTLTGRYNLHSQCLAPPSNDTVILHQRLAPASGPIRGNYLVPFQAIETYRVNPSAGTTYQWSALQGNLLNPSGMPQVEVQWNVPTDSGVVQVKAINVAGCRDSQMMVVRVFQQKLKIIPGNVLVASPQGDTLKIYVVSSSPWKIYSDYFWLSLQPDNGDYSDSIILKVSPNGNSTRSANLIVKSGLLMDSLLVVQYPYTGFETNLSPTERINFYPNPATNYFVIDRSDADLKTLEILDLSGSVLQTFDAVNYNSSCTYSTKELSNGIYFLRIHSSHGVVVKKFVVYR